MRITTWPENAILFIDIPALEGETRRPYRTLSEANAAIPQPHDELSEDPTASAFVHLDFLSYLTGQAVTIEWAMWHGFLCRFGIVADNPRAREGTRSTWDPDKRLAIHKTVPSDLTVVELGDLDPFLIMGWGIVTRRRTDLKRQELRYALRAILEAL